jgi:hypothetical protein
MEDIMKAYFVLNVQILLSSLDEIRKYIHRPNFVCTGVTAA